MAKGHLPQIIFHGAEPLLNREAVFAGIQQYAADFRFGVQTNATLLDESAMAFLREHDVSIGISLDAATPRWPSGPARLGGPRRLRRCSAAMKLLRDYPAWSVICTLSSENLRT